MATLKCPRCGAEEEMPLHCRKPMHVENVEGKNMLVCWMGAECGIQDVPKHCGVEMKEAEKS